MIRIAKQTDPKKLMELKVKIKDEEYLSMAIRRLAHTLTNEILNMKQDTRHG